jgi:putative toxin-antitoxin system antitoxin component (TIGR02293 family)
VRLPELRPVTRIYTSKFPGRSALFSQWAPGSTEKTCIDLDCDKCQNYLRQLSLEHSMSNPAEDTLGMVASRGQLPRILDFLGGEKLLNHIVKTQMDAHELISAGFPSGVLAFLSKNVDVLRDPEILKKAVGVSLRTTQRKAASEKMLTMEQSGKAWKFAEIMTRAIDVFGTKESAEDWLTKPAIALDQRRPIDLLSSPAGVDLVEDLLTRLEYGVFA